MVQNHLLPKAYISNPQKIQMVLRYLFADSAFEQYPFFMQFQDVCESEEIPFVFRLSKSFKAKFFGFLLCFNFKWKTELFLLQYWRKPSQYSNNPLEGAVDLKSLPCLKFAVEPVIIRQICPGMSSDPVHIGIHIHTRLLESLRGVYYNCSAKRHLFRLLTMLKWDWIELIHWFLINLIEESLLLL